MRTCSLPCYKRHQKWAQCSGIRDPTVYVKKSKLYTAAGVDHDYNFITSIERGLEHAERKLEDREIQPEAFIKGPRHEQTLCNAVRATKVIIEHAPRGMSRQKQNRTHWLPRVRCIEWSVEWLHEDNSKHLDLVKDNVPLSIAHDFLARRLKRASKKRKRDDDEGASSESVVETLNQETPLQLGNQNTEHVDPSRAEEEGSNADTSAERRFNHNVCGIGNADEDQIDIKQEPQNPTHSDSVKLHDIPEMKPGDADEYGNHYYLVKPRTMGSSKVLIPLFPNDVLSECLKSRAVLEFPTIQVLPWVPGQLPAGYQLEEDYYEQHPDARLAIKFESDHWTSESDASTKEEPKIKIELPPQKTISNEDDIYSIMKQIM